MQHRFAELVVKKLYGLKICGCGARDVGKFKSLPVAHGNRLPAVDKRFLLLFGRNIVGNERVGARGLGHAAVRHIHLLDDLRVVLYGAGRLACCGISGNIGYRHNV